MECIIIYRICYYIMTLNNNIFVITFNVNSITLKLNGAAMTAPGIQTLIVFISISLARNHGISRCDVL